MTKVIVSGKQIIKISEFMRNYLGKEYTWSGKITHKQMEMFLLEKNTKVPKKVSFNLVSKEAILKGDYIAVKDESSRILIYENPRKHSLDSLLSELHSSENLKKMKQARKQILKSLGYKDAINGVVEEETEIEYPLEHSNRQKKFVISGSNARRKKHY